LTVNVRQLPKRSTRVTATTTTEVFVPLTDWYRTLEALQALQVVLTLAGVSGGLQVRLGIQTAQKSIDNLSAAVPFADATLAAYLTTAGSQVFARVDPNGASDGNIDAAMWFRVGVFHKLAAAGTGVGDVSLEAAWR
jgi:hypothetical protein